MLVNKNGTLARIPTKEYKRLLALDDWSITDMCGQGLVVEAGTYECTLEPGHDGDHVAHGLGFVCAIFDDEHSTTMEANE